jgi:hypothetical protein
MAGGNDILAGTTGLATYNCLKQVWALARADGFNVVAVTPMNRTNASVNGWACPLGEMHRVHQPDRRHHQRRQPLRAVAAR